MSPRIPLVALASLGFASRLTAADTDPNAFFEKKIRPVLVGKCFACHADEGKKGPKGGLRVDTRDGLRQGGDSGPAVVPGDPGKSLLVKAIKGIDGQSAMPPKEKLSADVIADFEVWVRMGAPDPRAGDRKGTTAQAAIDIEAGKKHWAFQPVKSPSPPQVKKAFWPASDIDRFVLAKLEEKNLAPAADAEKRTLLRRITFDLTGLPPTPDEVTEFLTDRSPNAFEKVVDRLLASPRYGERWGRHWLDVARFAESSGKEVNVLYPFAWRYRDYVIAAFNADKPYNEFLKEQLAGDLLSAKNDTERAEHLIATGFLAVGPKSHNERNPTQFKLDLADEQIDAFSQAMLGLTVACARCHDHKFDPIPQKDYYALAGIFTSTDTKFGAGGFAQARHSAPPVDLPEKADVPLGPPMTKREIENRKTLLETLKTQRTEAQEQARKDRQPPVRLLQINSQITIIEKTLAHYDEDGTPKKLAMGVGDRIVSRDSPLYARGEPDKPGEPVRRGFPQVLSTGREPRIRSGSGRKELAAWVASSDNSLTARVMANRVWLHLFGRGIVTSPDNFGTTGQPPSHPELLDHLSARFVANRWSVKKLVREVVLSRTYQMGSAHDAKNAAVDPDDVYLWRMNPRRLDAEEVRDAMFAVSGTLDLTPPVGDPVSKLEGPAQALQRRGPGEAMYEVPTRAVYLPVVRGQVPDVLEVFDFAEPSLVTGAREDTTVPSQGLYLLNNPTVIRLAENTADRLTKEFPTDSQRIDGGFRLAFGRPATQTEEAAAQRFLAKFMATESRNPSRGAGRGMGFGRGPAPRRGLDSERSAWAAFAQALFAAAEFRYVD